MHIVYYNVLGAQKIPELRRNLAQLDREGADISRQLYNIGQADRSDILAAEVEAQKTEIDLMNAQSQVEREWLVLTSLIGKPDLPQTLRWKESLTEKHLHSTESQ